MVDWPADHVERRDLDTVLPYAKNARTHSDEQIEQIANSIATFGFAMPVLVDDDGVLIAGHARVLAARKLKLTSVPVMVATGWSDEQKVAFGIADNKLSLNAGWDDALLRGALGDLKLAGWDLALTGFSGMELGEIFADHTEGLTDPDEVPAAPPQPVTRAGDAWRLGRHRLVCGDATNAEAVALALDGSKPHLMVTDPPYGVDYDADWRNRAIMVKGEQRGDHGSRAIGAVTNDDKADWRAAWALFPGTVVYVWHSGLYPALVADSLAASRFKLRAQIVWVKTRPVISRGNYHWQHEPLLYATREDAEDDHWHFMPEHEVAAYAVRDGATASWRGGRKQSTVWFIENLKNETGHSTQKPVEAMRRPIENNSIAGQLVYDPFVGSGTTIVACEMTGRVARCVEIDPKYCDVGILRWQNFTGLEATLEATGETFSQLAEQRAAAEEHVDAAA
jgi:DNA modification methylase